MLLGISGDLLDIQSKDVVHPFGLMVFLDKNTFNANVKSGEMIIGGLSLLFDASRVVPTTNENRPRNVAFNYIVRAE